MKRKVTARFKEELNFKVSVTLVPPNTIERTEMDKTIRVVRTYG